MSQYPLSELKRRLVDDTLPLPKRLRLAKNVIHSPHFPIMPKERLIAEWLNDLAQGNKITSKELGDILDWLNAVDDLRNQLKYKIIKVVSQYLHSNSLRSEDIPQIMSFLKNSKLSASLNLLTENFLFITTTLLQNMRNTIKENYERIQTVFNYIITYYKESRRKLEFIVKLVYSEYLETVYSFLNTECHDSVILLCQNILFPMSKKQYFLNFFNHLIKKDSVDELLAEKGDNIQSVIKIMRAFFTFPNARVEEDHGFLTDFITTFVTCFRTESNIIFGFYVMATSALNMPQNYMIPAMKTPPIMFEENNDKIKRNIFLTMLEVLLKNEVDIGVHLIDTTGERVSRVEVKKTFMAFLQTLMLGQLKLEGRLDKTTLNIIKIAITLDPSLVEQKMEQILPHIMTAKKNNLDFLQSYTEMINCLLETLFKLSRGTEFIHQMIPYLKLSLEASNIEQFELKQKLNELLDTSDSYDKIKGKIITGKDILPPNCVEIYGKLTSELLFRQNKDLLMSLQKDFEENCLMMLEEGFVSPSIITLAESLAAILSSFLHHSKMADHTVPLNIAEDFWKTFQDFEDQCLNKFGECILKLNYNASLVLSFLKLCLSFCHLKLLNLKYSNVKLELTDNILLPFLNKDKWISFSSKLQEDEANMIWIQLLLIKTMTVDLMSDGTTDQQTLDSISETKTSIIKQISKYPQILQNNNYITHSLYKNLDKHQLKQLSKCFLKSYAYYCNKKIFQTDALVNNKELLQAILMKVAKNIYDCVDDVHLSIKKLSKNNSDINASEAKNSIKEYFVNAGINEEEKLEDMLKILTLLNIHYLDENTQLTAIFVLLIVKKCCKTKRIRRNVDYLLQSIYELSPKYPDLYKLFPIDFIFDFNDNTILDLLKLTIKTPNNMFLLKSTLELAVKKVKTDPEIIKNIVEILLTNHESKGVIKSIEYFKEPVFQIICILLPLLVKEKKAITTSAYRSILANLQDKLNKAMLDSFRNIDFSENSSLLNEDSSNTDDSMVVSDAAMATLNAMGAYTFSLLKYCESNDNDELKNMDSVLSGLEFFIQSAMQTIKNPLSKNQHVELSINLINVSLRYVKKLETHPILQNKKDKLFHQIWQSVKFRLIIVHSQGRKGKRSNNFLDEIAVTLKFLAELSTVECFCTHFVGDLANLTLLKKPSLILKNSDITNSQLTSRKVSKYLWLTCLKANIIEPKCVAITKLLFRTTKSIKFWIQQHYDSVENGGRSDVIQNGDEENVASDDSMKILKIEDPICEILTCELDILSEVILAAKKISLDYKFLDSIFELLHLMQYILGRRVVNTKCDTDWRGFVSVFDGSVAILNNLLLSREELLEDRWPCYMQCYKSLVLCLCERSTSQTGSEEQKLAEMAHSIEKLTQSICKRKSHVSRISAYAVADFCTWLEHSPPPKIVRQHLENSIALLIQVSDSTYAMAFIKRALAGSVGQMTMTNMYTMYKRYHKYVGNA